MKIDRIPTLGLNQANGKVKILIEHTANDGRQLALAENVNYDKSFKYAAEYDERFFVLFGNAGVPLEKLGVASLSKMYMGNDSILKTRRYTKPEAIKEFMRICREDLSKVTFGKELQNT